MITYGYITVEDFENHQFTIVLYGAKSLQDVEECADILADKIDAAIVGVAWKCEKLLPDNAQEGGAYDCTRQQLKLSYLTDRSPITFYLPAPKEAVVDAHQEAPDSIAKTIKDMLESHTTATGLIYNGGWLVSA